jgi:outer membrane protein assembly factor BamE
MRTILSARLLALVAACALVSGCLYHMRIDQGNVLNPDLVAQLEPGMTRSQVMFLLGTPMVPNGFNTDRWDYYYYFKDDKGKVRASQRLTVWFKDEKVDHFEGDALPKDMPAATAATG